MRIFKEANVLEAMFEILNRLELSEEPCILATVIHVNGSAYCKPGSALLIERTGRLTGIISAGCLEEDLKKRANGLFENIERFKRGHAETVIYDLSSEDDLGWGKGSGCNGIVHILLEPINETYRNCLEHLNALLQKRIPVFAVKKTFVDSASYIFIPSQNEPFGACDEDFPEKFLRIWEGDHAALREYSGIVDQPEYYVHLIRPQPRLIIFGANSDAKPLVSDCFQDGLSGAGY